MDEQKQARIVGMAMVRGLIGIEAVQEAAGDRKPGLLEALMDRGLLDEIDVEVLQGIPDEPLRGADPPARPAPMAEGSESSPEAKGLWRDLEGSLEDGREVRESFTLPSWKDYRDLRFLAEGGLGRIFSAFDPSLKRTVALKFLRRDDPELVRRFVLEAQHQAKVEHPNICKVFEVGEWKGQAYIAMQFIQGETLETAAPRMSLVEKVEVMEVVAEAMHAAHRQGLIHRDVKPANIMIEWNEGECPKPCVLDFGLAKGMEASGLTLQGMVIGTVHYMAPEQAMGQTDRIGRRTDVYGLGATLFKVITGRLVFQGTDSLDGVRRTVEEDPKSLRAWVPDLPQDLETIVMKCLEKEPERRYESALALAEDLRRFREGEPIQARPATWSYRIGKYVRKRKGLIAMAVVALSSVMAMGGWVVTTNLRARRISEFAGRFGTEAEGMAASLRMAYLLPRHDIRPHKAKVRQRMDQIRQLIQAEGSLAEGPGAYALGQGHLVLREFAEARRELEKAWSKGYRSPRVALALGQVLGELYREGWEENLQLGDLKLREINQRNLVREFRDPALANLRLGAGESPERKAYLEGLLAYYEERYSLAIQKAEEAFRQDPTLYEAMVLEGNARVAMATASQDINSETFLRILREAERPFAIALDMARSDPALIHAEGVRQAEIAKHLFFFTAQPQDDHSAIQGLLDQALAVDPDAAQVYVIKARLATAYATFLADHGREPFQVLDQAISWCEKATLQSQGHVFTAAVQGDLYKWKALYQRDWGRDPTETLGRSFACFQRAIAQRPGDAWAHQKMADVCGQRGDLAAARDEDPRPSLEQGLFHVDQASRLMKSSVTGMLAANLHVGLAEWERDQGQDPIPNYRQSVDYFKQAIALSPEDGDLHAGLVYVAESYALHQRAVGGPTGDLLRMALTASRRSVEIAPSYIHLVNRGEALRLEAQLLLDQGKAPFQRLREAEQCFRQAENLNPSDYSLYQSEGVLAMLTGEAEVFHKRSPEVAWSRAREMLTKASRMNARDPESRKLQARLAWLQGKWLQSQQRECGAVVADGLACAERGFHLKSRQPELLALRGCLRRLQAGAARDAAVRRDLLELAKTDLETALIQKRFLAREFEPELEVVRGLLGKNG